LESEVAWHEMEIKLDREIADDFDTLARPAQLGFEPLAKLSFVTIPVRGPSFVSFVRTDVP
jgi:hypothetical protein